MSYSPRETAERIRALRKKKRISQIQLALDLNLSRDQIAKVETGSSQPSAELLVLLSDYYDVSVDYILKGTIKNTAMADDLQEVIERLMLIKQRLT